jgi:HPt (histidine-containing phosphotransfer) domain-containing protein
VLDPAVLRRVRAMPPEAQTRVWCLYLRDAPMLVDSIRRSVAGKDTRSVMQSAHRLKSSSLVIGARRLSCVCARLEEITRHGEVPDDEGLLLQLASELACVVERLIPLVGTRP